MIGVWVLMVGSGWSRFYMVEDAELARLGSTIAEKKTVLQEHQRIANNYENLRIQYQTLKDNVDEHAKLLVKANNADQVYSSLIDMGQNNAFTYMNFIAIDSANYDQFGVLKFDVSGEGHYKNVNQFVNKLEYGRSLFKIKDLTIEPQRELDNLGKVNYSFTLESIFDRNSIFDDYSTAPKMQMPAFTYNSFYPLIHDVKDNDENLPNVEQSKLVSLGSNSISIRDQNGKIKYLYIGDRVYLGKLISVDTGEKSATFELNEGGIIKYITRVLQ
jgi:Tfp pilus assembly protein PilO